MRGLVIVIRITFSLKVVAVLILVNPCHAIYCVIVDTKKYEYKSNFFLIRAGISD